MKNTNLTCGFSVNDPTAVYYGANFPRLDVTSSKPGTWWRGEDNNRRQC